VKISTGTCWMTRCVQFSLKSVSPNPFYAVLI
jgi:hypothetical protein